MTREEVYKAVDSERKYQDRKWGSIEKHPHEVGAWLTLMREQLQCAELEWCRSAGDQSALAHIRKLLAIGVACCEQHGVNPRSDYEWKVVVPVRNRIRL